MWRRALMSKGLCIVESPFKGDRERNVEFAKNVCRALVWEGWNPYASHLFFPQFLDDDDEAERQTGISFGLEWGAKARVVFCCLREGEDMSLGMEYALSLHRMQGKITMLRRYTQEGKLLTEEEV
jgi:hypothetical protein